LWSHDNGKRKFRYTSHTHHCLLLNFRAYTTQRLCVSERPLQGAGEGSDRLCSRSSNKTLCNGDSFMDLAQKIQMPHRFNRTSYDGAQRCPAAQVAAGEILVQLTANPDAIFPILHKLTQRLPETYQNSSMKAKTNQDDVSVALQTILPAMASNLEILTSNFQLLDHCMLRIAAALVQLLENGVRFVD